MSKFPVILEFHQVGPRLGPKTAQSSLASSAEVPGCLPTTQCPETLEMPQDLTWTADDGDTFVCPERPSGSQDVVCLVGAERGLLWVCQKKSRRLGYLEFDRFWGVSHRVDVSPINPAKMTSWFEEVQKLWPPTPKPSKQFGGFDWGQSQEPLRISTWGFHHSISHGRIDKVHLSHFLGK
jgi:hypothetical protein